MLVPVYDIKNCGPRHRFSANGKLVHNSDKLNLQNLPSRGKDAGKLKRAIMAPPGHVIIDCDSSQIEARVLAWWAGQDDLVEVFEKNNAEIAAGVKKNDFQYDPYKLMASRIYNKPTTDITDSERFIGKTTLLGAGYGMGAVRFQEQLKTFGVDTPIEECRRIISTYRESNPMVVTLWKQAQYVLTALSQGSSTAFGREGVLELVPAELGVRLPNGLLLRYDGLSAHQEEKGVQYKYKTRRGMVKIYGGKCLAADTEVLTQRGWVPLVLVRNADRVWDGHDWVSHNGLTYQGKKPTIILNGVRMTPDHRVLTYGGWVDASSCQGLYRASFRMPDGSEICGGSAEPFRVGVQMPVRERSPKGSERYRKICQTWGGSIMRLLLGRKVKVARDVKAPSVLGMAVNAGSMQTTNPPSMAQLWGAGYSGLQRMGRVVHGILGGYGSHIPARAYAGSDKQQWRLLPRKLSLGDFRDTGTEYAEGAPCEYKKSIAGYKNIKVNPAVSMAPEDVYDIRNAGPRSQFVVRGASGPFIVHNCVENFTQALARIVVGEQLLKIAKKYRVVLTVHDAVACVAPENEAEEAVKYVEACMRTVPTWAEGLPINCESGVGKSYGEC